MDLNHQPKWDISIYTCALPLVSIQAPRRALAGERIQAVARHHSLLRCLLLFELTPRIKLVRSEGFEPPTLSLRKVEFLLSSVLLLSEIAN